MLPVPSWISGHNYEQSTIHLRFYNNFPRLSVVSYPYILLSTAPL